MLSLEKNGEDKPSVGILMMILASICFAVMAAMVKYLGHLPLTEIIFFRNLSIMLIVPLMLKNKKISFWGNNKLLLILRSLLSGFIMVAYFYSITAMNLTDAVTIKQLSPFFIILLASILLREKISFKLVTIFVFAFLGTLLVIKPGFRLNMYPAIIGLLGAVLTAGSHVAVRRLGSTDHPLVIVNYFGYIIGLVALGILLWQGNFYIPDILNLFILNLLGLVGLGGQIALTKAYQMAPTKLVSLYLYSQIIFSIFLEILFFQEIPDLLSISGAFLIIISGYLNYKLNLKLKQKEEIDLL
ncbi:MAG TPA: EamA family transporter [Candidatus Atribacteria bacterium]|nr:EamA family transporter [Candidatus Atribacteria bacterium]